MAEAAVQEQEQTKRGSDLQTAGMTGDSAPLSRTGAMEFGLAPRNFDEAWRMASVLSKSSLVPKQYQDKPEDILVAMQYGAEIGLPPMASLQSVAVINGKPGVYGDGFLGVIMSKPSYAKHLEFYVLADGTQTRSLRQADYANDETKAVSMFWRKGNTEPFVAEFSIGDAKRAKLWGKEGPWTNYPARQLKWRARGFAGRDGFAGELRGVKMAEELRDYDENDTPVVTSEPLPITEPVRRSEKAEATTDAAAASSDPVLENELPPPAGQTPTTATATTRAAASTAKPSGRGSSAKAAATTNGPSVTTESMVITNFQYVTPRGADPYYEISATVKKKGESPVGYVFVTRDEPLAKLAASCEGTEALFNITWHGGTNATTGRPCKVLEAIEAAN